ncbi:Adenine nucleotide transporter BT1, chloroplastic/amyloplastic/mitochondrial [Seminavis robusta]|uniref:Adenine nucleotide transporter BT1, chloroplastic/amyloplastic/mitochondrial n=1 Tax=Seminavis robusta TaxID=568900 RepID=A0A9N8HSS5_9STRA|nr:Adenine nucleotide transporter BT1, chloroplastic/amyloplastic/mitochondrial [Seminavis robusta]|eukprot:Sro1485_g276560.1 Adenine nucleotide transporter BT1, chloroplastic/amyloplastic/mitochondrial (504) ;mRNA; r:16197-17873
MGNKSSKPADPAKETAEPPTKKEEQDAPPVVMPRRAHTLRNNPARLASVRETFDRLDLDGSGSLDFEEVSKGLATLHYPANYAFDVFIECDENNDKQISFEEFKKWVTAKDEDMEELFNSIDMDNSGRIDLKELELFLQHLDMPAKNAKDLMKKLDKDGDELITFEDFIDGFALLDPVHFSSLKDTWMEYESDSDLAGVSAINVSQTAKRDEAKSSVPAWTSAAAGGLGNAFSRTVIAPLERTRVQMITDAGKYPSMMACMTDIVKTEGIIGFWAGNALNVGRIGPQMAIAFYAKDYFKNLYAGEGNKPTALQTLAASMSSGIVCQTGVYPIDLVRTRLMTSPGTYNGMMDCLTTTIKDEGITALYKGLLPANFFAVPYYGTQFFVYDTLKVQYATYGRPPDNPRQASPLIGIPLGAISSMTACFVAFPFQMAWKRLQVQGVGGRPVIYAGTFDCIKQVITKEGVRGVYAGLIPNLVKLAPTGAISFVAVEYIKDFMGWRPQK